MEEFMPPWASLLTYMGLASFVVLSIVLGWLIPKRSQDRLIDALEKRLGDRDRIIEALTAANRALDERNDLLADQVRHLVASGYATGSSTSTQSSQAIQAGPGMPGATDPPGGAAAPPRRAKAGGYAKASSRGQRRR